MSRPLIGAERAAALVHEHWGVQCARVQRLAGYDDTNWRVHSPGGETYVLKVLNASDSRLPICEAQNVLLHSLKQKGFRVPTACPVTSPPVGDSDGCTLRVNGEDGQLHAVRLLTWLPGTPLMDVSQSPALYDELGALLGRLDSTLLGLRLHHQRFPVLRREFDWNLMCLPKTYARVRPGLLHLTGVDVALLDNVVAHFQHATSAADAELRKCVVHSDPNESNVLVDAQVAAAVAQCAETAAALAPGLGLIDWGDACEQWMATNVAAACAYIMLLDANTSSPLPAAAALLAGYERELPLLPAERRVLRTLVTGRLALSLALGLHSAVLAPDNSAYLLSTQRNGWRLLGQLAAMSDTQFVDAVCPDVGPVTARCP